MKSDTSIFVLGCGVMQTPALKIARELGWYVVAADGNGEAVGRNLAHEFFPVDLKDTDALIQTARKIRNGRGPDGVFTAGTDFSLSVAIIADALGLPGHSPDGAHRASDKILMRQTFRNAKLPSPDFMEVSPETTFDSLEKSVPKPWVVKPVDSMGARGVILIKDKKNLKQAIISAINYSQSKRALVESYMEGSEHSLDALVEDGKFIPCGLADRYIECSPRFIEVGHTIPSSLSTSSKTLLWNLFEEAVLSIGLTRGAAKADLKLTPQGPMIGEIAARLSGGYMSGWTWPFASGIEPTRGALRLAVGWTADIPKSSKKLYCSEHALIGIDGTIKEIRGEMEAKNLADIREVFLSRTRGEKIHFPRNNVEKIGNVIAVGKSPKEAEEKALSGLRQLRVILDSSDPATGVYLDGDDEENSFPPDFFSVGNYFQNLWKTYPPKPSQGKSSSLFSLLIPSNLPSETDFSGYTLEKAILVLAEEGKLQITQSGKEIKSSCMEESQELSNFWKALVRGGIMGAMWYLDSSS